MSTYSWILVVHIVAISVWVGGMLANDLALLAVPSGGPPPANRLMRRWNRAVTIPAMVVTWIAGVTMVVLGGWYVMGWIWAKIAVVLLLSGLEGAQTANLRRLAEGRRPPPYLQFSSLVIVAAIPVIATLAVAKPF